MGNLWPLAMFFRCELETVKTRSNYFKKFMLFHGKNTVVDSMFHGTRSAHVIANFMLQWTVL